LCLDSKQRALKQGLLLRADREGAVATARIVGGSDTGVGASTTRVVIESATFQGVSVRSTSRRLGLPTEASARFEKQLHPDLAPPAAARLAQLLQQVAGAGAAGAPVDVYPAPYVSPTIRIEPK